MAIAVTLTRTRCNYNLRYMNNKEKLSFAKLIPKFSNFSMYLGKFANSSIVGRKIALSIFDCTFDCMINLIILHLMLFIAADCTSLFAGIITNRSKSCLNAFESYEMSAVIKYELKYIV